MFKIIKTENLARRGIFETVHGTIQTPFYECRHKCSY